MTEVVAVDLGGTKVAVARLRDGRLGDSLVEPTNRSSATALIDQLDALVERARSEATSAVGIGVPSVVEFETGRVVSSVNVPLADLPLRQLLGARLGVTATGRPRPGDAHNRNRRRRRARARRIYRGAAGGAGELGHPIVGLEAWDRAVPAPTAFPQPGSLESFAAGHALDRLAAQAAERHPASALGRLRAGGRPVGGGAALAGELLLQPATRVARGYVLPGLGTRTVIHLPRHGVRAGVLGAALVARHEVGEV